MGGVPTCGCEREAHPGHQEAGRWDPGVLTGFTDAAPSSRNRVAPLDEDGLVVVDEDDQRSIRDDASLNEGEV